MRFLVLASLALAAVLGASNASAGFIMIDNFEPGASRVNIAPPVLAGTPGAINVNGGFLRRNNPTTSGTAQWVFAPQDFRGGYSVVLSGLRIISGQANVNVQLQAGANVMNSAGPVLVNSSLVGSDLAFDFSSFGGNDNSLLAQVTQVNLSLTRVGAGTFSFELEEIHAVPEPTTMALLGLVGAGGGLAGWRKRRKVSRV